jgi:hypothetical protein
MANHPPFGPDVDGDPMKTVVNRTQNEKIVSLFASLKDAEQRHMARMKRHNRIIDRSRLRGTNTSGQHLDLCNRKIISRVDYFANVNTAAERLNLKSFKLSELTFKITTHPQSSSIQRQYSTCRLLVATRSVTRFWLRARRLVIDLSSANEAIPGRPWCGHVTPVGHL